MKRVYVVMQHSGLPDDYFSHMVKAYTSERVAALAVSSQMVDDARYEDLRLKIQPQINAFRLAHPQPESIAIHMPRHLAGKKKDLTPADQSTKAKIEEHNRKAKNAHEKALVAWDARRNIFANELFATVGVASSERHWFGFNLPAIIPRHAFTYTVEPLDVDDDTWTSTLYVVLRSSRRDLTMIRGYHTRSVAEKCASLLTLRDHRYNVLNEATCMAFCSWFTPDSYPLGQQLLDLPKKQRNSLESPAFSRLFSTIEEENTTRAAFNATLQREWREAAVKKSRELMASFGATEEELNWFQHPCWKISHRDSEYNVREVEVEA